MRLFDQKKGERPEIEKEDTGSSEMGGEES